MRAFLVADSNSRDNYGIITLEGEHTDDAITAFKAQFEKIVHDGYWLDEYEPDVCTNIKDALKNALAAVNHNDEEIVP